MEALKVIGQEHIGQYEFTGIEGGFGKDKKAMLVKDISAIHGRTVKVINQVLNMNRKRFRDGIDLIDLKQVISNDLFSSYGFTKAQWGNSNNIYLLSERGYAKLLKILEDDKAWEIYDELVDNYFNMRKEVKRTSLDSLKIRRLDIMEDNKRTRQGNLLYKLATKTKSDYVRERLIAETEALITGHEYIAPSMKEKEYSASEIGLKLGISANKVGRLCNRLGLKSEQPGQNEYGRWSNSKSKYSSKETPTWLYTWLGFKTIENEWKEESND